MPTTSNSLPPTSRMTIAAINPRILVAASLDEPKSTRTGPRSSPVFRTSERNSWQPVAIETWSGARSTGTGHYSDGALFAMCGVIVATIREDRIASARLYVEPVEQRDEDIGAAVEQLYRPPRQDS